MHGIIRARIARVEGLAAGEAFILTMPEANALFPQTPAEINLFVVNDGRKIEQAGIKVLYQTACRLYALECGFERFGEVIVLETKPSWFLVWDHGAAHPPYVGRNGSEF